MLMALTEISVVAGVLTFLFYCVIPLFIVFYLALSPSRKRQRLRQVKPDAGNAGQEQPTVIAQNEIAAPPGQPPSSIDPD